MNGLFVPSPRVVWTAIALWLALLMVAMGFFGFALNRYLN